MSISFAQYYLIICPIILILFLLSAKLNKSYPLKVLIICSIAILARFDRISLIILFTITSINFLLIQYLLYKPKYSNYVRRIGIIISLSPLLFYKIFLPFLSFKNSSPFSFESLLIPLGVSFYCLQQVTSLCDCSKPNVCKLNYIQYLCYSMCFIYLPAGPLINYRNAAPQFKVMENFQIDTNKIAQGVSLFILGMSKKVIIANNISDNIDSIYQALQNVPDIVLSATELFYLLWSSALQLYFEISAYSDMAIGLGLCFGLVLPINFDSPFKAKSVSNFINSWHMSIMSFMREYVFQPVFMNLKKIINLPMKLRYSVAWAIAVYLTYVANGLWHISRGINIYYFISISFGASLLVITELLKNNSKKTIFFGLSSVSQMLERLVLFIAVILSFSYFITPNAHILSESILNSFGNFYITLPKFLLRLGLPENLFGFIQIIGTFPNIRMGGTLPMFYLLLFTLIVFFLPNTGEIFSLYKSSKFSLFHYYWSKKIWQGITLGILLYVNIFLVSNTKVYFYGQ
ncbi:MBOAT family O-acyltransferase [Cyanobacterium sp. DS4]|uniref:MBOAT family O-acyltransferase n=1 Tax=Cyanobacterium sp. DS4 TaxID=2878255 RepID=UPI002E7FD285|nr:MBOAT family O-acyltransferase [Cyanobacterium sp. Dongsha4]WVL00172.1 hypothetical protein Dongsha4_16180 [Cyanobacterium sp. Dongsha4]